MSERFTISDKTLLSVACFAQCSNEARTDIAAQCRGRRFRAGECILSRDRDPGDVCFIVSGEVRVAFTSAEGAETFLSRQTAGEWFGELAALDGAARSAEVIACSDTIIGCVSLASFESLMASNTAFRNAILRRLTAMVRRLTERVVEFSSLSVDQRIRAELVRIARGDGCGGNRARIAQAPTHAELAMRVSTHREAVTRELNRLSRLGLFRQRGRGWDFDDIDALAASGAACLKLCDVQPA